MFGSRFGGKKNKKKTAQRETDFPVTRKSDSSLVSAVPVFLVLNRSSNNRPSAAVFAGKYVMVMGVIQAASPEPRVRAVKMADLSELAALHRRTWKLEVEELQQVLA